MSDPIHRFPHAVAALGIVTGLTCTMTFLSMAAVTRVAPPLAKRTDVTVPLWSVSVWTRRMVAVPASALATVTSCTCTVRSRPPDATSHVPAKTDGKSVTAECQESGMEPRTENREPRTDRMVERQARVGAGRAHVRGVGNATTSTLMSSWGSRGTLAITFSVVMLRMLPCA